jgi:hypothetical protein
VKLSDNIPRLFGISDPECNSEDFQSSTVGQPTRRLHRQPKQIKFFRFKEFQKASFPLRQAIFLVGIEDELFERF